MDALKLHHESIIIDGHCDTLIPVRDGMKDLMKGFDSEKLDKASRNYTDHIDIPRIAQRRPGPPSCLPVLSAIRSCLRMHRLKHCV